MDWKIAKGLCLALALTSLVAVKQDARAQADGYYKGKVLTILVGYPTGSAYTTYAQLTQRNIARFLPGSPTVTLKLMSGAGSLIAANYLADVAPKDGTTIATLGRGTAIEPIFLGDKSKAKFDPRKLVWLASLNNEVSMMVAWHTSGFTTFKETFEKPLLVAIGGVHGDAGVFARSMNSIMGTKFKIICCFHGSADQNLAMERGEVHARMNYSWSAIKRQHPDWLSEKKVHLLAQLALDKHADLPDVPLVIDLVKTPEDKAIMELVLSRQSMGRPYAAPRGITPEVTTMLRSAFERMMKDKEFLADADRSKIEINDPLTGEKVHALLDRLYGIPEKSVQRLRAALEDENRNDLVIKEEKADDAKPRGGKSAQE